MINRLLRKDWPSWSQVGIWLLGGAVYSVGYYLMDYSFAREVAIGLLFIFGAGLCERAAA